MSWHTIDFESGSLHNRKAIGKSKNILTLKRNSPQSFSTTANKKTALTISVTKPASQESQFLTSSATNELQQHPASLLSSESQKQTEGCDDISKLPDSQNDPNDLWNSNDDSFERLLIATLECDNVVPSSNQDEGTGVGNCSHYPSELSQYLNDPVCDILDSNKKVKLSHQVSSSSSLSKSSSSKVPSVESATTSSSASKLSLIKTAAVESVPKSLSASKPSLVKTPVVESAAKLSSASKLSLVKTPAVESTTKSSNTSKLSLVKIPTVESVTNSSSTSKLPLCRTLSVDSSESYNKFIKRTPSEEQVPKLQQTQTVNNLVKSIPQSTSVITTAVTSLGSHETDKRSGISTENYRTANAGIKRKHPAEEERLNTVGSVYRNSASVLRAKNKSSTGKENWNSDQRQVASDLSLIRNLKLKKLYHAITKLYIRPESEQLPYCLIDGTFFMDNEMGQCHNTCSVHIHRPLGYKISSTFVKIQSELHSKPNNKDLLNTASILLSLCEKLLTEAISYLKTSKPGPQQDSAPQAFWCFDRTIDDPRMWCQNELYPQLRRSIALLVYLMQNNKEFALSALKLSSSRDESEVCEQHQFSELRIKYPLLLNDFCLAILPNKEQIKHRQKADDLDDFNDFMLCPGTKNTSSRMSCVPPDSKSAVESLRYFSPIVTFDMSDNIQDSDNNLESSNSTSSKISTSDGSQVHQSSYDVENSNTSSSTKSKIDLKIPTLHPTTSCSIHIDDSTSENDSSASKYGNSSNSSNNARASVPENQLSILNLLFELVDVALTYQETHLLEGIICAVLDLLGELAIKHPILKSSEILLSKTFYECFHLKMSPSILLHLVQTASKFTVYNQYIVYVLCTMWQTHTNNCAACILYKLSIVAEQLFAVNKKNKNFVCKSRTSVCAHHLYSPTLPEAPASYVHNLTLALLEWLNSLQDISVSCAPWFSSVKKMCCTCYSRLLNITMKQVFLWFHEKDYKITGEGVMERLALNVLYKVKTKVEHFEATMTDLFIDVGHFAAMLLKHNRDKLSPVEVNFAEKLLEVYACSGFVQASKIQMKKLLLNKELLFVPLDMFSIESLKLLESYDPLDLN